MAGWRVGAYKRRASLPVAARWAPRDLVGGLTPGLSIKFRVHQCRGRALTIWDRPAERMPVEGRATAIRRAGLTVNCGGGIIRRAWMGQLPECASRSDGQSGNKQPVGTGRSLPSFRPGRRTRHRELKGGYCQHPPQRIGTKQANKGTLQSGFRYGPLITTNNQPHVRRRCRQHAQVAKTFKATTRCDARSFFARPFAAFSPPSGAVTAPAAVLPPISSRTTPCLPSILPDAVSHRRCP